MPHSGPNNCCVGHHPFEWECSSVLSKLTSHQICSLAKLPTEHVSAGNTHHDIFCARTIVPMPLFLCIVPVESCLRHRAPAIVLVPVAVPSCLCQCACARAIVTVPLCPRHCARTIVPPVPSLPCHCSITSDTHAVNIASVTNPSMVQPCWCHYRLY